jgi:hypothetical protein
MDLINKLVIAYQEGTFEKKRLQKRYLTLTNTKKEKLHSISNSQFYKF